MTISEDILKESLRGEPLGETCNFIWYISKIGIVALEKNDSEKKKIP